MSLHALLSRLAGLAQRLASNKRVLLAAGGAGAAGGALLLMQRHRRAVPVEKTVDDAVTQPSGGFQVATIGNTPIYQSGQVLYWTGPAAIDGDGSPNCYAPAGTPALDYLANAGGPGNWFGVVTDTGEKTGNPVVQGSSDPSPGKYVSATSLTNSSYARTDPRRYVDSEAVPYISVPPELRSLGAALGSLCTISYQGSTVWSIVADVGPRGKVGEISIAAASALGMPSAPKNGGVSSGVQYNVYLNSAPSGAGALSASEIADKGRALRSASVGSELDMFEAEQA